jgi:divalent metal cation (Fe/Co/Zn/Cd) transporter
VLLDTSPSGLAENISEEITKVSGVESIESLRVRQSGASTFADLAVNVPRSISIEEAHQIATEVEKRVAALTTRSDVVVHMNPVKEGDESISQTARAIASRMGLQIHHIHAHETDGEYHINLDVEVESDLSLGEAHKLISDFEDQLTKEIPQVIEINSHIEPINDIPRPGGEQSTNAKVELQSRITALVEEIPELHSCHKFRIWPEEHGYKVTFHCWTDPQMTVGKAHQLAEELEQEIYQQILEVTKAVIHMEPEGE